MTEKTLKFNNIGVNKKEFHNSKNPIDLMSVNIDQIVASDKFNHNNYGFKYFIGYQEGEIVKPLCIILQHYQTSKIPSQASVCYICYVCLDKTEEVIFEGFTSS